MARLDARLDDRLLHSEVIYACLPAFGTRRVVVATALPQREWLDPSALPEDVECALVEPGEALGAVGSADAPAEPTLIVFGTAADAATALEGGLSPGRIALANRARRGDSHELSPTYFVDEEELRLLRDLARAGTELVLQRVPSDPALPVALEARPPTPERDPGA